MKLEQDLKYAWRLLCKTPGFSFLCVIVIALGLTVSLTTFGIVYNFGYKSPDFPNGNRIVVLRTIDNKTGEDQGTSHLNDYTVSRIQKNDSEFDTIGAFHGESSTISDGESTRLYNGAWTTPNLMEMTQASPLLGRILHESDAEIGANPVTVISEKIWRNHYNSDPDIIGYASRINGQLYTIVGVMGQEFTFPDVTQDLWLPLTISTSALPNEKGKHVVIGLLKPGRDKDQASKALTEIVRKINQDYPDFSYNFSIQAKNHISILLGVAGKGVANLMLGIAIIVFALCCVNLATFLIVRANNRLQELAVRNAIGANIWQITSQVLIESFLICFIGGVFAIFMTTTSVALLRAMFTNVMPEAGKGVFATLTVNDTQIMVAVIATLLLWLITGGITAFKIARNDINAILSGSTKGSTNNKSTAMVKLIVGAEVIMSVFLVSLCGMFALAVNQVYSSNYGVAVENRFVGEITLNTPDYQSPSNRTEFANDLLSELQSQSLFLDATMTSCPPGDRCNVTPFALPDRTLDPGEAYPAQSVISVADNYFSTMEVNLTTGRDFDGTDDTNAPKVAIVSEGFIQTYWPDENPIGKQVVIDPTGSGETLTIVGVIEHIIQGTPNDENGNRPSFYRPIKQNTPLDLRPIVRTNPNTTASEIRDSLRRAVSQIDRNIPLVEINSLERFFELQRDILRPIGNLFIAIAAVTLVLAILGIFGVVYRSVMARKLEIGIRKSFGSNNSRVINIFLKQGIMFIGLGAVFGGGGAILASQLLTSLFANILGYLPFMLLITLSTIGVLILLASYLPAKKVIDMEPGDALRYE